MLPSMVARADGRKRFYQFQLEEPVSLLELVTGHGRAVTYRTIRDSKAAESQKNPTLNWVTTQDSCALELPAHLAGRPKRPLPPSNGPLLV